MDSIQTKAHRYTAGSDVLHTDVRVPLAEVPLAVRVSAVGLIDILSSRIRWAEVVTAVIWSLWAGFRREET
jgi:hypothetical protein